jgi:hypothetical protein
VLLPPVVPQAASRIVPPARAAIAILGRFILPPIANSL